MADSIYDYNQSATSKQMAGNKEDDIRSQIAALRANTDLGSFATSRTGTRADSEGGLASYNLSQQELEASGSLERQRLIDAQQSKLDQGAIFDDPMQADYYKGVKAGEQILGEKGLGRLGTDIEIQDVLSRYRGFADKGYNADVLETQRQQMNQEINRNLQTSSRGLQGQLARSGVKGGMAGAQMGNLYSSANAQRANVERDIFLKNADTMMNATEKYGKSLGELKSFDLGQVAKEKNIIMQSGFGFQQIGASDRAAKAQAESAAQQRAASSGGGKVICTELYAQGLMDKDTYQKDQKFGALMSILDPELMGGYHALALPIVSLMKKSNIFTKYVIAPIAMPWARYMSGQNDTLGGIIHHVGSYICIGFYKLTRTYQSYAKC